ncbi:MAG: VOC family protein [Acidobacteriota bacterium]
MAKAARPIPEGYRSVTPQLIVKSGAEALEFYKRAFGAVELMRMYGPDGKILAHAELRIGDSIVFVADEFEGSPVKSPTSLGGTSASIYLYVEHADSTMERAVSAGALVHMPPNDMFWGDRVGSVIDPFGYHWAIATHTEDLTPQEVSKRKDAFYAKMAKSG